MSPYWLKHIGRFAGFDQPIVIVQNQCDTSADEEPLLLPEGTLEPFRFVQRQPCCARIDDGAA
ncbi:MAG: hypothetical protein R3C05_15275 [Pirellulaceae bacterium]